MDFSHRSNIRRVAFTVKETGSGELLLVYGSALWQLLRFKFHGTTDNLDSLVKTRFEEVPAL